LQQQQQRQQDYWPTITTTTTMANVFQKISPIFIKFIEKKDTRTNIQLLQLMKFSQAFLMEKNFPWVILDCYV